MLCNRATDRAEDKAAVPVRAGAVRRPVRQAPVHLLLLGLSVLLPLALFAWTAWSERGHALAEAERAAARTTAVLHEHAARVLETNELVLSEVIRQTEGRPWEEIGGDGRLWSYLLRVAADLGQPTDITLADAEGRVRMTTARFPAARDDSLVGQEDFEALRGRQGWSYIGLSPETAMAPRQVTVSRRRIGPDGRFDGIVRIGVPVGQFTEFWGRYAPSIRHVVGLARSDGRLLSRWPASDQPEWLPGDSPFMRNVLARRDGSYTAFSRIDGVERINAFAQVKDYPLHIAFSVETSAVLDAWTTRMQLLGAYTALAAAALLGMALMAVRKYREQQSASGRWREIADRLAAESARREQAEAALRRAQTLEAVGQLTAGVAHDFNNLLQAIRSGLYLLSPRVPESSRKVLDASLQAVDRGAKLVRQLMVFSRREALEPRPVDVRALIAGVGELLQKAVGAPVAIETAIDADVAPALVDPTQAELAMLNLAINARDAMPQGGTLTIGARNASLAEPQGAAPAGDYVVLSVSDTGMGMPPEVLERVLEPFFTTKAVGKGTGLGLSMVHGFVTQSGGDLRIESRPGLGTTVSLWLPRAVAAPAPEAEPSAAPAAPDANGMGCSLLLVDDDALARLATAAALRELGHEVAEARDGEEALIVLGQRRDLRVMVTDYAMPQMNGAELALVARRGRPDLTVIMITGYAAGLPGGKPPGVQRLLRKPFRMEELDAAVREAAGLEAVAG
ncbi:hybrid sensor histidine kinase/response regulator [Roseicella aerolata]|uniref:histidine kinase n=1 Tax=Roseicella aerolata TaxID=2883479 RepID=A0A9X1IIC5_9PROT|nr:hybrid sensor histidine kinase/response regulator [Roseicella aerolata]MCB4825047.1 response regulator [Roseicella aerolata]